MLSKLNISVLNKAVKLMRYDDIDIPNNKSSFFTDNDHVPDTVLNALSH